MSQRLLSLAACFLCVHFVLLQVLADSGETWGGKRTSILVDHVNFEDYIGMGIKFAALKLKGLPSDADKSFIPSDSIDDASDGAYFMISACENTKAFDAMNDAVAKCTKTKCPDDFLLVEYWGTLPGMVWPKDGVLLYSCQVLQIAKKCSAPDANCLSTEAKMFTPTMVPDAVNYMTTKTENDVRMITQPSSNVDSIIKMLAEYKTKTGDNIGLPTGGGKGKHSSSKGDDKNQPADSGKKGSKGKPTDSSKGDNEGKPTGGP